MAFKVAELQDNDKAIEFMRVMREMLFLQKKNIAKWEAIEEAARKAKSNTDLLKKGYDAKGSDLLQTDLSLGREMELEVLLHSISSTIRR